MSEIAIIATLVLALIAAAFAVLNFFAVRKFSGTTPLSASDAIALLRFEGDAIRTSVEASASLSRLEVGRILAENQRTALEMVVKLSDSLLKQVDAFGTRLEATNQTTEKRINGIGEKLNIDIEQMGTSAIAGREALRILIEQKLDTSATASVEAASVLREELSGSFQRMRQPARSGTALWKSWSPSGCSRISTGRPLPLIAARTRCGPKQPCRSRNTAP